MRRTSNRVNNNGAYESVGVTLMLDTSLDLRVSGHREGRSDGQFSQIGAVWLGVPQLRAA
jgi:hypothetical protein